MATISDITTTPLSGLNHIDALLDKGPDWNYLSGANNTILYTFATDSGNEARQSGQVSFSASQQANARGAMAMVSALTGIAFVETASGSSAQVHFANVNITGANTSGLSSWASSYSQSQNGTLISYTVQSYLYLDNAEFGGQNGNLTPGGRGYETLLHEIGHMLGLKHPFEESITLPSSQDNSSNTLLSYSSQGGPYSQYSPYDVAALNWLYGGDGLGGALGIGSTGGGRYITGTSRADTLSGTAAADTLRGDGGNDILNGGAGIDTAIFSGLYSSYSFAEASAGRLSISGADGTDLLDSIEFLRFADQTVPRAGLGSTDVTPPALATASVASSGGGLVANQPTITGSAEAGAQVTLIAVSFGDGGRAVIGQTQAGADGAWSAVPLPLANGAYTVNVKSTDAAGNASEASAAVAFIIASPLNSSGGVGSDRFSGAPGNNAFDGKGGIDTLAYANARANYTVLKTELGFSVSSGIGADGLDSLVNMERIVFANGAVALDIDGNGGQSYRLYKAAFDRTPDLVGAGFWINSMDSGQSLRMVAQGFINSAEFTQLYGSNADDTTFVGKLYQNVLHRGPDTAGFSYWLNALNTNATTRADVLAYFSESPENQAQVIGQIQNGFDYTPWA